MSSTKKHALSQWDDFRAALNPKDLVFLTDFDGTQVPIKPRPELAVLSDSARRLLQQLHALPTIRLGVVTGRALSNVKKQVRLSDIWYLGNHGAEIQGPNIDFIHPDIEKCIPRLKTIAQQLRSRMRNIPGSQVESKRLSLSIHWRQVDPDKLALFNEKLNSVLKPFESKRQVVVTQGKCVTEVRAPVKWDKGKGIDWLLKRIPKKRNISIIYIGDDKTDEDGFRVLNKRAGGTTIYVGAQNDPSLALWYVKNPREVQQLMRRLVGFYRESVAQ